MKIISETIGFIRRQPWQTYAYILGGWIIIAIFNFAIQKAGVQTNTPFLFPISIFHGPLLHLSGLGYLILFLALMFFSTKFINKFSAWAVFSSGLALIILGNLGQGGLDAGFLKPFYDTGIQYYHDAVKITDWQSWLGGFNSIQPELQDHSRTHPPFAILIHYFALALSGGSITALSSVFVLFSFFTIPLVWLIFRELGTEKVERNLLSLLFSLIPAVNIYAAVGLDGVIMTASTVFLLGLVIVFNREKAGVAGILLCIAGFVMTNMLSFGGVFLTAAGLLLGTWEFLLKKKINILGVTILSGIFFLIIIIFLKKYYAYDHILSFITASHLENPEGFRALAHPWEYVMTRIEDVCEIALFFSIGCLAVFFDRSKIKSFFRSFKKNEILLMFSGVLVLLMMFASGAFRTGETARACLFIYPYLFLGLMRMEERRLRDLVYLAGIQTAAMQLFGGYFW